MRQIFLAILAMSVWTSAALAQGFQVSPLQVEGQVQPGTSVSIPITVTPTSVLQAQELEVQILDLTQSYQGAFQAIPGSGDVPSTRSARNWITAPERITVNPRDPTILDLELSMPASARGTYTAAVLMVARPPEDAEGLRVTLRLLIPIIISSEGRLVRQDVRLAEARMRYRFPETTDDATSADPLPVSTVIDAVIENNGATFSRFKGDIWIDAKVDDDDWRQIRRVPLNEIRLLPETAIAVPVDLDRLLPTGTYRVRGELYVDGRRTAPLRREIAFEGHPSVTDLQTDVELPIDPDLVTFTYQTGATRSEILTIMNPALDPVDVTIGIEIPEDMAGRASALVRDLDITAAGWLAVQPETIRLRPGQSRNVRLVARFPATDAKRQNYYAGLKLDAFFTDGQRAGAARGLVEVKRQDGEDLPEVDLAPLQLAETDAAGQFAASLRLTNLGNVIVDPTASYTVLGPSDTRFASGTLRSVEDEPLVPLGARSFGGTLDLSGLPEGEFTLLVIVSDAGREIGSSQQVLTRSEESEFQLAAPL